MALGVQCLATASLLWELGYWTGCAAFANAQILRDGRGIRVTVGSVPRNIDGLVHRIGGGDTAIRKVRDGVLDAIATRWDLPAHLFRAAEGPDWLGFEPWLGRLLDELELPLDWWTARSLWALRLDPLPLPGPGEVGYWSVPWPEVVVRRAAAAVSGFERAGWTVSWIAAGAGAQVLPGIHGGGEEAVVLSGRFEPAELLAVERWVTRSSARRALVVGEFPPEWNPRAAPPVDGEDLEGSLLMTGLDGGTARRVRNRWKGRFGEDYARASEAMTALASHRFREGPSAATVVDPAAEVLHRCLRLRPRGVPVSFVAAQTGMDELQVVATARGLGAAVLGEEIRLLVPGPPGPDPLHLELAGLLSDDDPGRLVALWLGGAGASELERWARDRLCALDGLAVLRLLAPVDLDAFSGNLLELLAEAAVDTLDLALLRAAVERMSEGAREVWKNCVEAIDGRNPGAVDLPGPRAFDEHARAAAETALRLLEYRSRRSRKGLGELRDRILDGVGRLGGDLELRFRLEAEVLAEPGLLDDRRWRRRAVGKAPALARVLRRRAGVLRMVEGRNREARRLLRPLAESEELPGLAGLLELDLGALALAEYRWEETDRRLLRALRLLRAAGFVNRTRTVCFNLAVAELDRLRVGAASRRFEEAGSREDEVTGRAELARLALARGDEQSFRRLAGPLPRGKDAERVGLGEAVALLDGVVALMGHDLPRARRLFRRGAEEGRTWGTVVDALEGRPSIVPPERDGWGLSLCARCLERIREGRGAEARNLFPRGCTSLREALALALCERLVGIQDWIDGPLRRAAVRILRGGGLDGWAAVLDRGREGEGRLLGLCRRMLDGEPPEALPPRLWLELCRSLGAGGLEIRERGGGGLLWRFGEGSPGEEIPHGLLTIVPLGVSVSQDDRWELLASVVSLAVSAELPAQAGEDDLGMIGRSPALEQLRREIRRLAPAALPVVFLGETGVGKELAARAIHRLSARQGPFVPVNMAALPHELAEAELFGAVKGAFTGADRSRRGLITAAEGGTLFLDEIGELDLRLQAKLLRFLESGEVRSVGSESVRHVDVRVVSATNRDLEAAQRDGNFRPDLYYRLGSAMVRIPPLRERRDDIPLLAEHFGRQSTARQGTEAPVWGGDAVEALRRHDWPGNVRELKNVVEVALLRVRGTTVHRHHLPIPDAPGEEVCEPVRSYESAIREFRRSFIVQALERNGGNRSATARELGISRQTLLYHIRNLGIR